jgi:hypothetical protein
MNNTTTPRTRKLMHGAAIAFPLLALIVALILLADEAPECYPFMDTISIYNRDYVATARKLGLAPRPVSTRENVIFGPDHFQNPHYLGSRGYEFRFGNTIPQGEIHTTINLYDSAEYLIELRQLSGEAIYLPEVGVTAYLVKVADGDNTWQIRFLLGQFDANVKTKFMNDAAARDLLIRAASLVISELRTT